MYDCAVIGLGAHGSSTLYHLAKSNLKCIGFEQNDINQNEGSSQNASRIIRQAYFEGAHHYEPFINRAYEIWDEIEKESKMKLFNRCGLIYVDLNEEGEIIDEVVKASLRYNYPLQKLTLDELENSEPFFKFEKRNYKALIEKNAGMLYAHECLTAFYHLIKTKYSENAEIKDKTKINKIIKNIDNTYTLFDNRNKSYTTKNLVLSAGSWLIEHFDTFKGLQTYKKHFWVENAMVIFFKFKDSILNSKLNKPFYIGRDGPHHIYGFPDLNDGHYLKIGIYHYYNEHDSNFMSNKIFDKKNYEDILKITRNYINKFEKDNIDFLSYSRCSYTVTSDSHYIIDKIPLEENAFLISACSGHGFKFCSSIGEHVAKLVKKEEKPHEFFKLSRLDKITPKTKF